MCVMLCLFTGLFQVALCAEVMCGRYNSCSTGFLPPETAMTTALPRCLHLLTGVLLLAPKASAMTFKTSGGKSGRKVRCSRGTGTPRDVAAAWACLVRPSARPWRSFPSRVGEVVTQPNVNTASRPHHDRPPLRVPLIAAAV